MIKNASTNIRWQLWIVAIGFFMQSLDTTIVNTALPSIANSLNESPLQMHSIIVAYVLTVAVTLPLSGWLADRIGVKRVFLSAIILFTLGSLLCGQATTLNELIFSRVVQGFGGAMMVPVGRLTVMKIVPREQYMAAMTFVTLPGQIGPLVGPALGGFLVEYAQWQWIFLINLPVGIIGAVATFFLMPNYKMPPVKFDIWGFVLIATSMAGLTLALDGHSGLNLSLAGILLLATCGIVTASLYLRHAKRSPNPIFDLNMFRIPTFNIGLWGSLCGRIGSGMLPFMTPLFLQIALGFSPFHAGLMMIPMIIGSMSIKKLVVKIVNIYGYRRVLVVATLLLPTVTLAIAGAGLIGWLWAIPVLLFILGMINAVRFSTMNTLTLKELPDIFASGGNSMLSMVMQLAMSLGISIAGILLVVFSQPQMAVGSEETRLTFMFTYLCIAFIMALPALIFWHVPNDKSQDRPLTVRNPENREDR